MRVPSVPHPGQHWVTSVCLIHRSLNSSISYSDLDARKESVNCIEKMCVGRGQEEVTQAVSSDQLLEVGRHGWSLGVF